MASIFNEISPPSSIEIKFIELCNKLLPEKGFGVYDVRYLSGSSTLRILITKSGSVSGIGIDDCISVDKLLSPFIDEEDWLPQNFVLEVSSPGLFREIRTVDQLKYSVGELVKVKTNSVPEDKTLKNQKLTGTLLSYNAEALVLEASIKDRNEINLEYKMIKSVNAEVEL